MKYLITFTFLVLCLSANAQKDASFLIGRWKVVDAILPKNANAQEKRALKLFKPNLLKSLFKFDSDGNGKFRISMDNIPIEKNSLFPEDISWSYSVTEKRVTITERSKLKDLIAQLHVKIQDGSTYFILGETTVILKVVKYK